MVMDSDRALVKKYLEELVFLRRSAGTVRLRTYQLRGYVVWLERRGSSLGTVGRRDIMEYLAGPDHQIETVASNAGAVRALHRWMLDSGWRSDNPCAVLPRMPRSEPDPRPIPDDVFHAAMARASRLDRGMLVLGRFAGLRAMEIAAAHTRDLGGAAGRETLTVIGKGGKRRVVPAHRLVVEELRAAGGFLLPSTTESGHWLAASVSQRLKRRVLPEPWTAHSLRHAYATEAYALTGDLVRVQMVLGHSDVKTTRRYVLPHTPDEVLYQMGA